MKRNNKKKIVSSSFLICSILVAPIAMGISNEFRTSAEQSYLWKKDSTGWWYEENNTYPTSQWKLINNEWYYFNSNGYMVANTWIGDYYLGSSGAMLKNTTTPDGYKVDSTGAWVKSNWEKQGNDWILKYEDGTQAKNQWAKQNGKWYYFNNEGSNVINKWIGNYYVGNSGAMLENTMTPDGYKVDSTGAWVKSNWEKQGNDWILKYEDGTQAKNQWAKQNGKWYYFNNEGSNVTNNWIGDYYVGEDGAMITDATSPDGKKVDSNGKVIVEKKVDKKTELDNIISYNPIKPIEPINPIVPQKPSESEVKKAKEELQKYIDSMNMETLELDGIKNDVNREGIEKIKENVKRAKSLLKKKGISFEELEEMKKMPFKEVDKKKSGLFRDLSKKVLVDYEIIGEKDKINPHNKKAYSKLVDNKIKIKTSLKNAKKFKSDENVFIKLNYVKVENFNKKEYENIDVATSATPKYSKDELPVENYEVKAIDDGYEITINKIPEDAIIIKPIIYVKFADNTFFENGGLVFVDKDTNTFDDKNINDFEIKTQPTKTKYNAGENFDSTGMVIVLTDNKGLTKEINSSEFIKNGFIFLPSENLAVGTKNIEVRYENIVKNITITVEEPKKDLSIKSIISIGKDNLQNGDTIELQNAFFIDYELNDKLPKKFKVRLSDESEIDIDIIEWGNVNSIIKKHEGGGAQTYVLNAVYDLPDGVIGEKINVTISVKINPRIKARLDKKIAYKINENPIITLDDLKNELESIKIRKAKEDSTSQNVSIENKNYGEYFTLEKDIHYTFDKKTKKITLISSKIFENDDTTKFIRVEFLKDNKLICESIYIEYDRTENTSNITTMGYAQMGY